MQVFIKISVSSSNVGPTFSIIPNIGTSSIPVATTAQITGGIYVTLSDPSATFITITSLGACADSEILLLGTTTTTSSTSSTTSTTTDPTCNNVCYKLTNTVLNIPFNFSYKECGGTLVNDTIQGAGEAGSIVYICSSILPVFTVPLGTSSVIIEPILDSDPEIINCPYPCYFDSTAVVIDRDCISSVKMLFDLFKKTLPGENLNNLSGPTLLKNYLDCPSQKIDHCALPNYGNLCDITCSPLFLGGINMQQQFVNAITPKNNCYSSDIQDCCWLHVSPPTDTNDYCYVGGINYTDQLPTSCYECLGCYPGYPSPICTQPYCIDEFGVRMHSNCLAVQEGYFENPHPLYRLFGSTLQDIRNEFSPSQWQDIINLHIIESGAEIYTSPSLLTNIYTQLSGLPTNLKYEYLKVILENGLVITQGGWGGCDITFSTVNGYLCQNELLCTTTSTTSTSTTSTSSTTTTTTCLCNAWDIVISQDDIDDAVNIDDQGDPIPGEVIVSYKTCNGTFTETAFNAAGSYPSGICSCCTPSMWYFKAGNYIETTLSTATQTVIDCSLTTTTTILPCECVRIVGIGDSCSSISEGTYIDCDGNTQNYFLPLDRVSYICTQIVPPSKFVQGGPAITQTLGGLLIDENAGIKLQEAAIDLYYALCPCAGTTTTTTSTSSTTTTTTCNCFVTQVIAVNEECDPCEQKLPANVKYTNCEGIEIIEPIPSGVLTVLLGCPVSGTVTAVSGSTIKELNEIEPCCNITFVDEVVDR